MQLYQTLKKKFFSKLLFKYYYKQNIVKIGFETVFSWSKSDQHIFNENRAILSDLSTSNHIHQLSINIIYKLICYSIN